MRLHKELAIPRFQNGDCKYGIQDLFALIIALRYLLEERNFPGFFDSLKTLIYKHPDNPVFPKRELLKSMGFPTNWQDVSILPV